MRIVLPICFTALAVAGLWAYQARHEFIPHENGVTAVADRWTGCVNYARIGLLERGYNERGFPRPMSDAEAFEGRRLFFGEVIRAGC